NMNRHIQRRAGDEIFIVQISHLRSGRSTGDPPHQRGRRHTDGAEKWRQFQSDPAAKIGRSGLFVESDYLEARIREFVRKGATARRKCCDSEGMEKFEADKSHLQGVAELRAFHVDWAAHRMCSRSAFFDRVFDDLQ